MAAFTALALGLAGAALASSFRKKKPADATAPTPPVSAPAPIAGSLAAPAPPDAVKAASDASLAAQGAAVKVRRKAKAAELGGITGKGGPISSVATAAAVAKPKTLSGY